MPLEAFLSSSIFRDDDRMVVNEIKAILSELEIEYVQAEHVSRVLDDTIGLILKHKLFIAILTPGKAGEISPNVSFEIGVAVSHGIDVIILREDSIKNHTMYSNIHYWPFNRENLLCEEDDSENLSIKKAIEELCNWYGYKRVKTDSELERRYEFAKAQAQSLGSTILGYFNEVLYRNEVRDRAIKNFPTKADIRANRIIINKIQDDALTGDDGIISEESIEDLKSVEKIINESEFVWIIDPIDGTLNFAYGFPFFCVSIGLIKNGEPVLGVIYNPSTQELYCGRLGVPSECLDLKSGTKRLLELKSGKSKLEDCIVMSHLSSNPVPREKTISVLDQLMVNCRSVRMLGSGQMALVSVALGQFDIFFNYQTHIWDIVPGYVILKGAGGYATSSLQKDNEWDWQSRGILAASNSKIGEKFRKFLCTKLHNFPTY